MLATKELYARTIYLPGYEEYSTLDILVHADAKSGESAILATTSLGGWYIVFHRKEFSPMLDTVLKDSSKVNENFNEVAGITGRKFDQDKNTLELLPFDALEAVGRVLQHGKKKYSSNNWRGGMAWSRLLGAALRHLFAWGQGEDQDPETGESHLAHAACCVLFLLAYTITPAGQDDRFKTR